MKTAKRFYLAAAIVVLAMLIIIVPAAAAEANPAILDSVTISLAGDDAPQGQYEVTVTVTNVFHYARRIVFSNPETEEVYQTVYRIYLTADSRITFHEETAVRVFVVDDRGERDRTSHLNAITANTGYVMESLHSGGAEIDFILWESDNGKLVVDFGVEGSYRQLENMVVSPAWEGMGMYEPRGLWRNQRWVSLSQAVQEVAQETVAPPATPTAGIRVLIDGQPVVFDVPPRMIDGRVMVPMRAIFEAMGAEVDFDSGTQTITAHIVCGCEIIMRVGSTSIIMNGQALQPMDVAPSIIDGRTLVPLRFVAQTLNSEVVWDGANSTALINTDPFIRLNPQPVTLTNQPLNWRQVGDWIIYYLYTGGVSDLEREIVDLVNIERARVGAPPLTICPLLSAAARFKSQEMVDLRYFAHDSPVYGDFINIPRGIFGANHIRSENLARRVSVTNMAQSIVDGLMGSPGHRANKLDPAHEVIGVGVVFGMGLGVNFDGTPIADRYAALATQMFGVSPGNLGENALMDMYRAVTVERYGVITG